MTRQEKAAVIDELKEKFSNSEFFYIADSSAMTVEQINTLRRTFFEKGIEMKVVKNTLAIKALESAPEEKNYAGVLEALKGPSALLFTEVANAPAKVIKDFAYLEVTLCWDICLVGVYVLYELIDQFSLAWIVSQISTH